MELLADKELIENVKRLVNSEEDRGIDNNNIVQQGGYVFGLIPAMGRLFAAAVKAIGRMFVALYPILFKFHLYKLGKKPVKDDEGNVKIDEATGEVQYENVPLLRPHIKPGEGNLWKYLKFCAKISIYLCIFALGGIIVTVFGIIYLYSKLAKHFGKLGVRGDTSDESNKKNGN
tara:strand:- start:479 stop:1000 length:522 start_codon:yes stop_codon:yes gene_type:complete